MRGRSRQADGRNLALRREGHLSGGGAVRKIIFFSARNCLGFYALVCQNGIRAKEVKLGSVV